MAPDSKSSSRWVWLLSLALIFVTFALYWPVRHFDFVEYDDPDYVFENPTVRAGLSWYGLAWSVVDAHASNWHPATWLSHMLDCQLFGLEPGAHHLVNVVLHCANSALLLLLLRSMTGSVWRSAMVAALFAWHPLRVESVAWISERKDVLSGFFFLLTLLCYTRHAIAKKTREILDLRDVSCPSQETRQRAARRLDASACWYCLALLCFSLGLLSKPMLVTLPCLLLLLDYWPLARVPQWQGSPIDRLRLAKGILLEKAPFLLMSAGVALLTVLAQRHAMVPLQAEPTSLRFATFFAGYFGYLEKILWPKRLCVLYLRPEDFPTGAALGGLIVLLVLSAVVLVQSRSKPYLIVGWFWFLGMLLPVSGLLQTGLQSIADRYTYLPAIGLGLMAVWGFGELATAALAVPARRALSSAVAASVLLVCAILTREQLGYWQNTQTLMGHALAIDPGNYVAHQDLARFYSRTGRPELARSHRESVRALDPLLRLAGQAAPAP